MTVAPIGGSTQADAARKRPSMTTSLSLLRQVQADDRGSWEAFVDLYGPLVYCYCRQFGLSHDEAAEIVQEVMLYLIDRRLRGFRHQGTKGAFRKWLHHHTRGRILDRWSRQQQERRMFREYAATQAVAKASEPAFDENAELHRLDDDAEMDAKHDVPDFYPRVRCLAARKFQSHVWEAFERTAVLEHPARQVAASLGMTVSNVRNAKFRVGCWLRTVLAEEFGISDASGDSSRELTSCTLAAVALQRADEALPGGCSVADAQCPSRDEIRAFLGGQLPDSSAAGIKAHLLECDRCETTVRELERVDPFLSELRRIAGVAGPDAVSPWPDSPELGSADDSGLSRCLGPGQSDRSRPAGTDRRRSGGFTGHG